MFPKVYKGRFSNKALQRKTQVRCGQQTRQPLAMTSQLLYFDTNNRYSIFFDFFSMKYCILKDPIMNANKENIISII